MSAETIKDLAIELIEMNKTIKSISK
ncbi:hypothetical protein [Caproiciproducens sp. MSJ-32]|nr:hypothetical protein [Caproiciproducens sp. MSJ-32]